MKKFLKNTNKQTSRFLFGVILILAIFSFSVINMNNKESVQTNSSIANNKKIGWGIKRNLNNEQPDVGNQNRMILESNGGICLGSSDSKKIYLTFDQGYEAGYTKYLLETLKNNNVNVTFFLTAHYINTNSEIVELMINEGHIIGNHTVNHKSMPDLTDEKIEAEVMNLHKVLKDKFNYEMKYIRPPMGEFSEKSLQKTKSLGYTTVMWSFAYEDWNENNQPDEQASKEKILNNLHNGAIILLHGNSKTNANILDGVIKEAKNLGYEFKSLNEFE